MYEDFDGNDGSVVPRACLNLSMFCFVFLSSSAHPSSRALSRFNLLCFARRRFRSVSD